MSLNCLIVFLMLSNTLQRYWYFFFGFFIYLLHNHLDYCLSRWRRLFHFFSKRWSLFLVLQGIYFHRVRFFLSSPFVFYVFSGNWNTITSTTLPSFLWRRALNWYSQIFNRVDVCWKREAMDIFILFILIPFYPFLHVPNQRKIEIEFASFGENKASFLDSPLSGMAVALEKALI